MANLDMDSSGSECSPPNLNTLSTYLPSNPIPSIQPNTGNDQNNHNVNLVTTSGSPVPTDKPLPEIPTTPKSPQTNNDSKNSSKKNTSITFSTFSEMYKSKLLPWYMKKERQSSFSNTDITNFYNYNKCSNYEKYENYFSRYKPTTDQYMDICMDKSAIELKELHTHTTSTSEKDITKNDPAQESSGTSGSTNNNVEEEITQAMSSIALNEVSNAPSKDITNNVLEGDVEEFNDCTLLSPSSNMDTDQFIENNVTFEFQQDNTYPVVSTNVYPPNAFDLKNNKNKRNSNEISNSQPQYPVLSSIENYSAEEFII